MRSVNTLAGHALTGAEHPPLRVHGRKRSHRISIAGGLLLDGLLPLLCAPLDVAAQNPMQMFSPACRGLWLEIGFGDGGHLARQAAAHPQIGFIGCEPYINGVAHLLEAIAAQGLPNIRIHPGDARVLLAALPPASIARIYILFPDPWPRKRHHKRRFMAAENMAALARVLRPGGELCFATDSEDYWQSTLALLNAHPDFAPTGQARDDAPMTRYEAKAVAAGRTPHYLRFIRVQPGAL